MEMEKEKEMEKKYSVLHKKLDNLESQLTPIISESLNTETTPSYNIISEEISQNLHFVNKLLTAEMASNPTPGSGRDETRHLAQIAHRVRILQSVFRAWSKPGPTSSIMEPREAPRCSYTDLYDDHVDEGEEELGNYYDDHVDEEEEELGNYYDYHVEGEGFNFYENPVFLSHDDDRDGLMEFGELGQDDEDHEDEETVMDDNETEDRRKNTEEVVIRDDGDQNKVGEHEGSRITEDITRVYYDQKEEMTQKAQDGEDGYDNEVKTHYCYKVVFWVGLIGMGIISVMAGFSDFPEYHSSVVILTPT